MQNEVIKFKKELQNNRSYGRFNEIKANFRDKKFHSRLPIVSAHLSVVCARF